MRSYPSQGDRSARPDVDLVPSPWTTPARALPLLAAHAKRRLDGVLQPVLQTLPASRCPKPGGAKITRLLRQLSL
jgi:hypothetical protein